MKGKLCVKGISCMIVHERDIVFERHSVSEMDMMYDCA